MAHEETCGVCDGKKKDEKGNDCWQCQGSGVVEVAD